MNDEHTPWVCDGRTPTSLGVCPCGHVSNEHSRAGRTGPVVCETCAAERLHAELTEERKKKDDIVYIQRDIEAIKHTLDKVLRPYKDDVKRLREENASLRESIARKEADQEALLRLIQRRIPETLDEALGLLVDKTGTSASSAGSNWLYRLGVLLKVDR